MTNCCASIGLPAAPSSTVNASIIRSKTIAVVSDHTPILCCNWAWIAIKGAQPITVKNLLKLMNDKQMFIASNSIDYKNGRKKPHFFYHLAMHIEFSALFYDHNRRFDFKYLLLSW